MVVVVAGRGAHGSANRSGRRGRRRSRDLGRRQGRGRELERRRTLLTLMLTVLAAVVAVLAMLALTLTFTLAGRRGRGRVHDGNLAVEVQAPEVVGDTAAGVRAASAVVRTKARTVRGGTAATLLERASALVAVAENVDDRVIVADQALGDGLLWAS